MPTSMKALARKVRAPESPENAVKPRKKVHPIRTYSPGGDRRMAAALARLEGMPKQIVMSSRVNDRGAMAVRCENWRQGR